MISLYDKIATSYTFDNDIHDVDVIKIINISILCFIFDSINDIILSVNEVPTVNVTHSASVDALKRAGNQVRLVNIKIKFKNLYVTFKLDIFTHCESV